MIFGARFNLAGHPRDGRHAVAAFAHGALGTAKRGVARVGVYVLPGTVVGGVEDQRVLVQAQRPHFVHDAPDARIQFHDRIGILAFRQRLADVVGVRHVGLVDLHEVDVHEEGLFGLGVAIQVVQRGLFHVAVKERNADHAFLAVHDGRVHILPIDLEFFARLFAGVARQRAARDLLEHGAQFWIHVGEPGGIRIGVGVKVIQARVLHFVIALGVGQRIVRFAQVPLAGEECLVATGFQYRGQRPFLCRQAAALALERNGRHAAAVWNAAGLHGGAPRGATGLCVKRKEGHAFLGQPVDVGRGHATARAAAVRAKVAVAGVVGHDKNDVGFTRFLRRDRGSAYRCRRRHEQRGQAG
ncbi:hypothetical protein D3C71_1346300 [compost metagenome]